MECCGRESAEGLRERLRGESARFRQRPVAKLFGQERSAGNRGGAAAAQKTRFGNAFPFHAHGKLQNIAAHGIADFYFGVRAVQFSGIARILKMVENSIAEHQRKYGKTAPSAQRTSASNGSLSTQRTARNCWGTPSFFRRQIFLVDGRDDHVIWIDDVEGEEERRTPLHFLDGLAEKARDANCFAGAERYLNFVRDRRAVVVGGRYEMVRRRGGRQGIAAGWRLLAHGFGGGYRRAAADTGNWVSAVQAGDGREIAGAAIQFFGNESAHDRGYLCRHSIAGWNCWTWSASGDVDSENALAICGARAHGEEK